ncbi:putative mediator of RNA polymerase II transcription subunit 24 [Protopterus annectens]|uniref:putative mediator of RNA polymerase II transcription subunit 24 n=1 Tax=Protopterus annectens TaxID=7888 RepID=UPI001CFA3279|nr:putative mediator of RNA polymerase II transcription subunit 24 [Protopterus annectens]
MANGTGEASPILFTQQNDDNEGTSNSPGNLTALVEALLGRVDALTQKVEALSSPRPGTNAGSTNIGSTNNSTLHSHSNATSLPNGQRSPVHQNANNDTSNTDQLPLSSAHRTGLLPPPVGHALGGTDSVRFQQQEGNNGIANNGIANTNTIPLITNFLGNNNFFSQRLVPQVESTTELNGENFNLSDKIEQFDNKLYKCKKLQLEVSYLNECIGNKVVPKGLRQWRFPAGLANNSPFYQELTDLFDRQGFEFLKALISFYSKDITTLTAELETLEQEIVTNPDFFRYKYKYSRIFSSIEASISKLLFTKKKKLTRDITDYSNNRAYPRLSNKVNDLPYENISDVQHNNDAHSINNNNFHNSSVHNFQNNSVHYNDNRQLPRRSPRFNNNNNNNATDGGHQQGGLPQVESRDNNQPSGAPGQYVEGTNQQDHQDFRPVNNAQRYNPPQAQMQNNTRNKRKGRRR